MAKGICERLLEQAIKFHQWQEATYPGKTSEELGGEWEVDYPYHEPEEPQTKEQLWAKLVEQNKKFSPDDPDARRKLYNHCCMFGTARDAVDLFEEIQGVPMADSSYRDAIARYLYLGEREKALQTAERLATSRLWAVAGPTQVRPMSFFEDPNLREFLLEPESLRRIREAAFIDDGSLIRK